MPSTKPALHVDQVPLGTGTDYPPPHDVPCRQRRRRRLSDAFALSQFGVNLLELAPGVWSSQRHWHERQDEFVYVLEGEVTLVTNEGDTILKPGMFAGFRAGEPNGITWSTVRTPWRASSKWVPARPRRPPTTPTST